MISKKNNKKKLTFFRIMKLKTNRILRWLIKPFKTFRKGYRLRRFLKWSNIWYDVGEIAEDWWEDDSISPTDLEDLFLVKKARYFYDKYTNAYYFSHWSGTEDNYEYHAELTHLRDELEEEYGGFTTKFSIPFYEYYDNFTQECEQFRLAFLNDFRIESPWDFVDEDRSELSEDPMLIAVPPFILIDHPQHHHEHKWIHTYHDEDNFVMNKWDQEEGELLVVGHQTRDEYEWDDEVPFWTDPKVDTLFFDKMRKKWLSHGPVTSKEKVGYNLDLIIEYSLRDYYGFLAYDDNINISFHLANRWNYEKKDYVWLPSDVYAQKQLDLIVEHLAVQGALAPYFYTWAAPTHQEVREYMIQRSNALWIEARKRIFFKLGNISLYIKMPYLKFKIWAYTKIVTLIKTIKFIFSHKKITFIRLISWITRNIIWMIMHSFHLLWGAIWGTAAILVTIEFLHYCLDENIITIWMKEYPGEQEIGLPWLYIGIVLHLNFMFGAARSFGYGYISSRADVMRQKHIDEVTAFDKELNPKISTIKDYWKYRSSHSSYATRSWTKIEDKYWLLMGLMFNIMLTVFDDQMAFHWYLEDWLHIQIAVYDWPILNGDVYIDD